ncbi:resolvase-like protein [Pacificibacter maritimus]|uniref:Resolvase-like protein n=1 Tax=Pacificibacter maritimus TaxID=762213 RepID=A0A3N4U9U7_9RHOB|nr:resolvase-like protein [Pacificibacter maritimus]
MTRPLRAALYACFSTDMQRDASIDDPVRTCRDYATRQGLEVVEVFSHKAMAGASLMRSGIQNLLRSAASGPFDSVISQAQDRLWRNQADIASVYQMLEFKSVAIETVSKRSISEMHIGLKGTMNALFLKDLGAKTQTQAQANGYRASTPQRTGSLQMSQTCGPLTKTSGRQCGPAKGR